jgi:hypothetical protein
MLAAGYPKALIPFHVPNNITCLCVSPLSFHIEILLYQHGRSALDTSRTLFLLASTQGVSCRLVMNHLIYVYVLSHPLPPHIYVSKCVYVYVHISLFLPECACTTIIDISPRIFNLMYCWCVSIIIVICICPPGALVNKLISIYWKCNATDVMYFIFINQEACFSCKFVIINII